MSSFQNGAKELLRESVDLGLRNHDPESWKTDSPPNVREAVAGLRECFEEDDDNLYLLTNALCHARLHHARTGELKEIKACTEKNHMAHLFRYLCRVPGAVQEFEGTLHKATPPALFRTYLDAYVVSLAESARRAFKELMEYGNALQNGLSSSPVAWSEAQVKHMIRSRTNSITAWIMDVCSDPEMPMGEQINPKTWRAPRLIQMRPARDLLPYDASQVWELLDSDLSWKLVQAFADEYVLRLDRVIRIEARWTSGHLAKRSTSSASPLPIAGSRSDESTGRLPRSRSRGADKKLTKEEVSRHRIIFPVLRTNLTGRKYCEALDKGGLKTPQAWQDQGCPKGYSDAYMAQRGKFRKRIQDEKYRMRKKLEALVPHEKAKF